MWREIIYINEYTLYIIQIYKYAKFRVIPRDEMNWCTWKIRHEEMHIMYGREGN